MKNLSSLLLRWSGTLGYGLALISLSQDINITHVSLVLLRFGTSGISEAISHVKLLLLLQILW